MARQTVRQKQAKKVSQAKRKKQQVRKFRFYVLWPLAVMFFGAVLLGSWIIYDSGIVGEAVDDSVNAFHQKVADSGLKIERIAIAGRIKTPQSKVLEALGAHLEDSIFIPTLSEVKETLEAVSSIREASVERIFPNTISITLLERKAVAIWQYQSKLKVIDVDGVVLEDEEVANYPHLLTLVGVDVPVKVRAFLRLMQEEKELAEMVSSATRVGKRRWNIKMKSGVRVMLPEDGEASAWSRLAEINDKHQVLKKSIKTIDMRVGERIFIRLDKKEDGSSSGNTSSKKKRVGANI